MNTNSNIFASLNRTVLAVFSALVIVGLWAPLAAHSQNLIVNGSFEILTDPSTRGYTSNFQDLATNGVPGWVFGVSEPGGNFTAFDGVVGSGLLGPGGVIEDGTNCAFAQGTGSFSQTVDLTPGIYQLSYYAMGRTGGSGPQAVAVTFGDLLSVTNSPNNSGNGQLNDWLLYTYNVTVPTSGSYTLQFAGTIPYDVHDWTTYIDNVSLVLLASNLISNGSFETPSIASDEYTTTFGSLATNGVPGWSFGTSANASYNGLATFAGGFGTKSIEQGTNAAFVQGSGSLSQTVALTNTSYQLSYYLMGRTSSGNGANPTAVSLGNLVSVTNTPGNSAQNVQSDWILYTYEFTVTTPGSYTLEFAGTDPYGTDGDHTTFIDNVGLFALAGTLPNVTAPQPQFLYAGETANFTVSTSGTTPLSFQWQENGANLGNGGQINGATTNTLTITGVSPANAGDYSVVVSNLIGSVTSSPAPLAIVVPETPYEEAIVSNSPFAYYRFNETADPSTGTTLAYDYAGGFNGIYGVDVENSFDGIYGPTPSMGFPGFESSNGAAQFLGGDANSVVTVTPWNLDTNTVTITAWLYPYTGQAANAGLVGCVGGSDGSLLGYTAFIDSNADYTLGYTWDSDPNTYNWNSGLVPTLNQWSLVALAVTPTNASLYVISTDGLDCAIHSYPHPVEPFSALTEIGNFPTVETTRGFNGVMDEVTVFNHVLSQNQLVTLFGAASGVTNVPLAPPAILTQPVMTPPVAYLGQSVQVSGVTATGGNPLSYQWMGGNNGTYASLTDGGGVSGSHTPTLTITNLNLSDPTNYFVMISNASGAVTSQVVQLQIYPVSIGANLIVNGSFESPAIGADTYTVNFGSLATNGVPGWAFGVSEPDGDFTSFNGLASFNGALGGKAVENGNNAAFIQGTGSIAQTLTLSPGNYVLSIWGMSRAGFGPQPVTVALGNVLSENIAPTNTAQNQLSDWSLYTDFFTVTNGGPYTLELAGTIPYDTSDLTTFLDNISINAVFPPGETPPQITSVQLSDGNIVISGTSPNAGATYYILSTTNLTTPFSQWTPVATNTFAGGGFTNSIPINEAKQMFFGVDQP